MWRRSPSHLVRSKSRTTTPKAASSSSSRIPQTKTCRSADGKLFSRVERKRYVPAFDHWAVGLLLSLEISLAIDIDLRRSIVRLWFHSVLLRFGFQAAHRFPLQFTIKANEKITLWSANSGKKHCPPTDYVVKTVVFPWSEAGSVHLSTTIFDPRGKKMAKRVSRVRSFSSGFSHKSQRIDDEDDEEEDSMDDDADLTTVSVDEPSCGLM